MRYGDTTVRLGWPIVDYLLSAQYSPTRHTEDGISPAVIVEETEMTSIISPLVMVGDAISGARPGARREVIESYIKRLQDMENIAKSYTGVTKTYAIQAGRELRVIVGADQVSDKDAETLSGEIAKKIQEEMVYPGQVKITVIRETRSVAFAK